MTDERRLRTRTLIQLGGLVERSGLLEALKIDVGQDLQKDSEVFNSVAILSALLCENAKRLSLVSVDDKTKWIEVGRELLQDGRTYDDI